MEGYPGIVPIVISDKGWATIQAADKTKLWYLDFRTWEQSKETAHDFFPHPSTMPTNTILAMNISLEAILSEGLEAHFQKYIEAARRIRSTITALGREILVDEHYLGPILTPLVTKDAIEVQMLTTALAEMGIIVARGLGKYSERSVRIANIGLAALPESVDILCAGLNEYVRNAVEIQV